MKLISTLLLSVLLSTSILAQNSVVKETSKQRKNIVRWNITPMIINTKNLTLGYERVINKNQTASMNLGILILPKFLSAHDLPISTIKPGNRFGYTVAADYRFYLTKRNQYSAPNGVYIGPYVSRYSYAFDNTITLDQPGIADSYLSIDSRFSMTSVGFELGYQFIFWNRFAVDLILIGPSLSYYYGKIDAEGQIEIDEDSNAYEYIHDELLDEYPWLETFVDMDAINTGGKFNATSLGFRYVIQIGFHF